jgi:hypothetical protein
LLLGLMMKEYDDEDEDNERQSQIATCAERRRPGLVGRRCVSVANHGGKDCLGPNA